MVNFTKINKIHLYSGPTSMKMGIKKIQLLVALNFTPIEIIHSVFIFCSKNQKTVKIYYENEYGDWLLQNKIEGGRFKWPQIGESVEIDKRQLDWLFKGLSVVENQPKEIKHFDYY